MVMRYVLFLVLLNALLLTANAARVLVVFPMPSRSHTILGDGIVKELLDAGHEVTYITPVLTKNPPPKLHQVDISSNFDIMPDDIMNLNLLIEDPPTFSPIGSVNMVFFAFAEISKAGVMHDNVQAFLNDVNQKFDLVIADFMFSSVYSGFSQVFQCPLIWFSALEPTGLMLRVIDDTTNPAYVPEITFAVVSPLSFSERVSQLTFTTYFLLLQKIVTHTFEQWTYEEAFGHVAAKRGVQLSKLSEAELSASLMLVNSDMSMANPTRLPQNCKPIGGFHISNNTKPLPQDLKKIMDNAKDGVIYFSMGSNLKSKDLPDKIKRELLDVFGSLKQTVIWKFEEVLGDLPKNVHILQWAPQPSILAHPNCVLFITHGGHLSTTETIHFGVPIIGIPGFGDQFTNIHKAALKGFAIEVRLNYDLPSNLKVAINNILSDPRYRETVKRLSSIYHDRPVPPAKEMLHWVEHVLKTKGAPHLRSTALTIPLYQKLYLDLIALIAVIFYGLCKVKKLVFPAKKLPKVKTN